MCVMNHRAAVLASPASRTQIGFFQQVLLRRGDDETWFRTASAMFYQHQWELLTGLLAPYAGGVPMRAGPPFCAADTPHAPFVLLVPRFASVLCDIVERRYVTASTSNACTTCGEVVSMRAARDDPGIGVDEMDAVEHWFRGEVRSLCAPLSLLLRMMLARLLRPSRTWNVAVLHGQWWTDEEQERRHRDPSARWKLLTERPVPDRVGSALPSAGAGATKRAADEYRQAGYMPFVRCAFEPAPLAADAAVESQQQAAQMRLLLGGVSLAQRTPLDFLHMASNCCAAKLSVS
jgi:hypothetical protein